MGGLTFAARPVIPGAARGTALVSREPISFWGGYDWQTGEIIDRRHPLSGENARGKILAVPSARGSSTTTAVLLEAIRAGTAPCAIITTTTDFFFALASVVAGELYSNPLPVVAMAEPDFARLRSGDHIEIDAAGTVTVSREANGTT
jgi:predicted aconitase with swiveling domain